MEYFYYCFVCFITFSLNALDMKLVAMPVVHTFDPKWKTAPRQMTNLHVTCCHRPLVNNNLITSSTRRSQARERRRWNKTWHSTSHHRITSLQTIKSELNIFFLLFLWLFHFAKRFSYWSQAAAEKMYNILMIVTLKYFVAGSLFFLFLFFAGVAVPECVLRRRLDRLRSWNYNKDMPIRQALFFSRLQLQERRSSAHRKKMLPKYLKSSSEIFTLTKEIKEEVSANKLSYRSFMSLFLWSSKWSLQNVNQTEQNIFVCRIGSTTNFRVESQRKPVEAAKSPAEIADCHRPKNIHQIRWSLRDVINLLMGFMGVKKLASIATG